MKDIKIVNGKAVFPEGIKMLSSTSFDKPEEQSCWGCIVEQPKENATKIK